MCSSPQQQAREPAAHLQSPPPLNHCLHNLAQPRLLLLLQLRARPTGSIITSSCCRFLGGVSQGERRLPAHNMRAHVPCAARTKQRWCRADDEASPAQPRTTCLSCTRVAQSPAPAAQHQLLNSRSAPVARSPAPAAQHQLLSSRSASVAQHQLLKVQHQPLSRSARLGLRCPSAAPPSPPWAGSVEHVRPQCSSALRAMPLGMPRVLWVWLDPTDMHVPPHRHACATSQTCMCHLTDMHVPPHRHACATPALPIPVPSHAHAPPPLHQHTHVHMHAYATPPHAQTHTHMRTHMYNMPTPAPSHGTQTSAHMQMRVHACAHAPPHPHRHAHAPLHLSPPSHTCTPGMQASRQAGTMASNKEGAQATKARQMHLP